MLCTLLIPTAILTEALLSFLGLGITEPTPTWGNMINSGQIVLREAPWLTFFPGAAIVLTVLAFNLLGDFIRDSLDPSVREAGPAGVQLPVERPSTGQSIRISWHALRAEGLRPSTPRSSRRQGC